MDHRKQAKAALEEFLGERHEPEPEVITCDYCGDELPSVKHRAHIPTTPDLQRRGFDADKIVCPKCAKKSVAPHPRESDVREALLKIIERNAVPRGYEEGLFYSNHKMVDAILAEFPILSRDIAAEIEAEIDMEFESVKDRGPEYRKGLYRAVEIARNGR